MHMTQDALLRAIVAWLVYAYGEGRVPTSLLAQVFKDEQQVSREFFDRAVDAGIERGLLRLQTAGNAAVVSATPLGREFAQGLIAAIRTAPTPDADALLERLSELFLDRLKFDATDLAVKSGRQHVEPLHVIMAAKTLTAGSMYEQVTELDRMRDKTSDRAAEDSLLALIFQSDGSER